MIKPMLACPYDPTKVKWPMLGSPKLDGIRCLIIGSKAVTRSLKPVRNRYLQEQFAKYPELEHFDGEIIVGVPYGEKVFARTTSSVNTELVDELDSAYFVDGKLDFSFYVFDRIGEGDYKTRFLSKVDLIKNVPFVKIVGMADINSEEMLAEYEASILDKGYEGVMLRNPKSPYKYGRATPKEHGLAKVKRFQDAEAVVISLVEEMKNENVAKQNELGYTSRSSHQENLTGKDTLGSIEVKGINGTFKDVTFFIGTGLDDQTRKMIWDKRDTFVGQTLTYKYFEIGAKDKPRFPVFKGFRSQDDFS